MIRAPLLSRAAAAAAALAGTSASAACEKPAAAVPDKKPDAAKKKEPAAPSPPKSINELVLALSAKGRHVFLSGTIDDDLAYRTIATLLYLDQQEPGVPIRMHINSSGGKVQAGLAIHDVMQTLGSPVHTRCLGHCESMAAILLAAGQAGHRSAMPNARIMIHQPVRTGGYSRTNAKQLQLSAASIDRSRLRLAQLLADHSGRPLSEIESLIEYDHECDAQEALELGLIDRIVRGPSDLMPGASNAGVAEERQSAAAPAPPGPPASPKKSTA